MEISNQQRNIVVIGGGPAGIEASRALDAMGYTVFLVERDSRLGGHLGRWDRLFPYGTPAEDVLSQLTASMGRIKWFTSTEVTQVNKLERGYNVILSNGLSVLADALLLTTGFTLFNASKKEEYGYGIYDRVITNADLEDYFSGIPVPAVDNPRRIGFVHCVGSRDEKVGNRYCSKVCCATAVKQACEIKEKFPDAVVYCFYMDLRMFGRGYEDMYLEAQKKYRPGPRLGGFRGQGRASLRQGRGHPLRQAAQGHSRPAGADGRNVPQQGRGPHRAHPCALHHGGRLPQAQGLPHGRTGVILHGSLLRRSMHRPQDPA